jgi:hypothetical protein
MCRPFGSDAVAIMKWWDVEESRPTAVYGRTRYAPLHPAGDYGVLSIGGELRRGVRPKEVMLRSTRLVRDREAVSRLSRVL